MFVLGETGMHRKDENDPNRALHTRAHSHATHPPTHTHTHSLSLLRSLSRACACPDSRSRSPPHPPYQQLTGCSHRRRAASSSSLRCLDAITLRSDGGSCMYHSRGKRDTHMSFLSIMAQQKLQTQNTCSDTEQVFIIIKPSTLKLKIPARTPPCACGRRPRGVST